jgi:hypothetical protein
LLSHSALLAKRVDLLERHLESEQKKALKFSRLTLLTGCVLGEVGLLVATYATLMDFLYYPQAVADDDKVGGNHYVILIKIIIIIIIIVVA